MSLDALQALRGLRRQPVLACGAIVALALGIGANLAVFGVARDLVLRPFPYRDAERVIVLWGRLPEVPRAGLAPADFFALRRDGRAIAELAGAAPYGPTLAGEDGPERLAAMSATSNLFALLGVEAAVGRVFGAGDERALALLDHGLWQRGFGGRRDAVGRTLRLDGEPVEIVGVLPPGFAAPWGRPVDLWVLAPNDVPRPPIQVPGDGREVRGLNYLWTVARLAPGAAVDAAQEELGALSARYGDEFPDTNRQLELYARSLHAERASEVEEPLVVLAAAAAAVLLLAIVDVAMLLLTRATARSADDALRSALGARRARLARVPVWEGGLLAAAGALAGIGIALPAARAMVVAAPVELPVGVTVGLDAGAVALAALLAAAAASGVALLPAWRSGAADPARGIAGGARAGDGRGARRLRSGLIALQACLALMLLAVGAILGRALLELTATDPGFTVRNILTARVDLPGNGGDPTARVASFLGTALDELRAVPGVEAAGAAAALPLSGSDASFEFWIEGSPDPPAGEVPLVGFRVAEEGFFETLGIPLVAGRSFDRRDHAEAAPVVLVNEELARRHLDGSAVGRRLRFRSPDPSAPPTWFTVVGVIGDVRHAGLDAPPRPEIYLNAYQLGWTSLAFVVRTAGEPEAARSAIERAVGRADPGLPLHQVRPLDSYLGDSLALRRYLVALLAVAAGVALLLAAVGVYGVVGYDVTLGRRELSIRAALGAGRRRLLGSIVGHSLAAVGLGCALGALGSVGLAGWLSERGLAAGDGPALALVGAALLLLGVGAAAAVVPARRALAVDGAEALRGG